VLQNLARKARRTTPYQIIAEAIEELNIRPILRSRYRLASERALANAELFLEMARAYDGRGLTAFAEAQVEGRPDAEADSVPIMTMHLAKGSNGQLSSPSIPRPNSMTTQVFCTGALTTQCISSSLTGPQPTMSWSRPPKEISCAASASASGTSL
jgi:hypothetical protein